MKVTLGAVGVRRGRVKTEAGERLFDDYLKRMGHYVECEAREFASEGALLEWLERQGARSAGYAILLDSRGRELSSEEFAARMGRLRDGGIQRVVAAIGPADGWSAGARERADLLWSLGRLTLPHGLARVVMAEQVYRAMTILAGHPYHSGH